MSVKIQEKHAKQLLTACGIPSDDAEPTKLKGRLESLPELAKEADFTRPEGSLEKRLLKQVLDACVHGKEIELVNGNGHAGKNGKAPKEPKAEKAKPAAKSKPEKGKAKTNPEAGGRGKAHHVKEGTIITKEYKGKEIKVTATTDGFKHGNKNYSSLTQIAKDVTGADSINGPKFFGLVK